MPSIYHLFLLRKALLNHLGENVADEILPAALVKGDGIGKEERAQRAVRILEDMDRKLDEKDVKIIRRSMSCYLTKRQMEVIDQAKERFQFLELQVDQINRGLAPSFIEPQPDGYNYYFNQPRCICRVFSKDPHPNAPQSYCECCGGNILRIFKYWLEEDLDFTIVQTFLIGGDNCVFKLTAVE